MIPELIVASIFCLAILIIGNTVMSRLRDKQNTRYIGYLSVGARFRFMGPKTKDRWILIQATSDGWRIVKWLGPDHIRSRNIHVSSYQTIVDSHTRVILVGEDRG